jgi:hypothetical protein
MLKLTSSAEVRFESNYNSCTGKSSENICIAPMEWLGTKERQDETQFTTKIAEKTSLNPTYFV